MVASQDKGSGDCRLRVGGRGRGARKGAAVARRLTKRGSVVNKRDFMHVHRLVLCVAAVESWAREEWCHPQRGDAVLAGGSAAGWRAMGAMAQVGCEEEEGRRVRARNSLSCHPLPLSPSLPLCLCLCLSLSLSCRSLATGGGCQRTPIDERPVIDFFTSQLIIYRLILA